MAARNITLQFGDLVSLPLKKESAIDKPQEFVNLCTGQPDKPAHDPSPRRQPYVCEQCGPIVDNERLVKGLKAGSSYVIMTQDEVAEAKETYASEYKGVLKLVAHPAAEFLAQTAPGESVSFLYPATDAIANQYQTLVAFITAHPELVFVGLNTPMSATSLFQVTVRDGVLIMAQRVRSQALKALPAVAGEPMEKLQMFLEMTLEDSLTEYDPTAYEDRYAQAIEALAAETDRTIAEIEGAPKTAPVAQGVSDADMLTKLAALSAPKAVPAKKAPAKRAPAKKAAAKKTTTTKAA